MTNCHNKELCKGQGCIVGLVVKLVSGLPSHQFNKIFLSFIRIAQPLMVEWLFYCQYCKCIHVSFASTQRWRMQIWTAHHFIILYKLCYIKMLCNLQILVVFYTCWCISRCFSLCRLQEQQPAAFTVHLLFLDLESFETQSLLSALVLVPPAWVMLDKRSERK